MKCLGIEAELKSAISIYGCYYPDPGVAVRLNTRNIIWALLAISFVAGSIWIHYQVKVEMPRGGSVGAGLFQAGDASPKFSATDLQGRQMVWSELQHRKVVM